MRKQNRETTREDAWHIFDESPYISISMLDGKEPYTVMVNGARIGEVIYFHCALEGKKLDCIRNQPRVCISAVCAHEVVPEKQTVAYASCIMKATAEIIEDIEEKRNALYAICERYTPMHMQCITNIKEEGIQQCGIVRLNVTEISGKQNLQKK